MELFHIPEQSQFELSKSARVQAEKAGLTDETLYNIIYQACWLYFMELPTGDLSRMRPLSDGANRFEIHHAFPEIRSGRSGGLRIGFSVEHNTLLIHYIHERRKRPGDHAKRRRYG